MFDIYILTPHTQNFQQMLNSFQFTPNAPEGFRDALFSSQRIFKDLTFSLRKKNPSPIREKDFNLYLIVVNVILQNHQISHFLVERPNHHTFSQLPDSSLVVHRNKILCLQEIRDDLNIVQ